MSFANSYIKVPTPSITSECNLYLKFVGNTTKLVHFPHNRRKKIIKNHPPPQLVFFEFESPTLGLSIIALFTYLFPPEKGQGKAVFSLRLFLLNYAVIIDLKETTSRKPRIERWCCWQSKLVISCWRKSAIPKLVSLVPLLSSSSAKEFTIHCCTPVFLLDMLRCFLPRNL